MQWIEIDIDVFSKIGSEFFNILKTCIKFNFRIEKKASNLVPEWTPVNSRD